MGTIEFQCISTIFPFDGGHSHSGCFFGLLMRGLTKALSLLQEMEGSTSTTHDSKVRVCERAGADSNTPKLSTIRIVAKKAFTASFHQIIKKNKKNPTKNKTMKRPMRVIVCLSMYV